MDRKKRRILRKARRTIRIKHMWKFFDDYTSECIVAFAISTVLLFSIVVIVLAVLGIELSSIFIEYFFKFFGFEMLALSGIKISKTIGSAFGRAEEAVDGTPDYESDF